MSSNVRQLIKLRQFSDVIAGILKPDVSVSCAYKPLVVRIYMNDESSNCASFLQMSGDKSGCINAVN